MQLGFTGQGGRECAVLAIPSCIPAKQDRHVEGRWAVAGALERWTKEKNRKWNGRDMGWTHNRSGS